MSAGARRAVLQRSLPNASAASVWKGKDRNPGLVLVGPNRLTKPHTPATQLTPFRTASAAWNEAAAARRSRNKAISSTRGEWRALAWFRSRMDRASARPSPNPRAFVVNSGSITRLRFSAAMPTAVSLTATSSPRLLPGRAGRACRPAAGRPGRCGSGWRRRCGSARYRPAPPAGRRGSPSRPRAPQRRVGLQHLLDALPGREGSHRRQRHAGEVGQGGDDAVGARHALLDPVEVLADG
jgi:hypothetical protein